MKPLSARPFPYVILAAVMLSTVMTPGVAPSGKAMAAQAGSHTRTEETVTGGTAATGGIPPQQEQPRNDTFMGTGGDQSYIGRDPATGDRIMESKGPPRHQDMPQQQVPMIIAPEINVNGTWGQQQPNWSGGQGNQGGQSGQGGVMRPTPLPKGGIGTGKRQ